MRIKFNLNKYSGNDRRFFSRGMLMIILGITVVMTLVTAGIRSHQMDVDSINQGFPNLPPYPIFLQLFMSGTTLDIQDYAKTDDFFFSDWDDSFPANGNSENETDVSKIQFNRPGSRAITGERYNFAIRQNLINHECILISGPENARMDDCTLLWIPSDESRNFFSLAVVNQDTGVGKKAEFLVTSTEEKFYLGTDNRGRCVAALMLISSKWVLFPGMVAVITALFFGVFIGGLTAYFSNVTSKALLGFQNLMESIPFLIIIFIAAVTFDFNMYVIMFFLGLFLSPMVAKNINQLVNDMKARQFVEAGREMGFSNSHILFIEIIWYNGWLMLLILACNLFALALIVEVTLSYLQLGVRLPDMSWGTLLNQGKAGLLMGYYWLTMIPVLAIVISISGFYLLSGGLNKRFRVRMVI